VPRLIDDTLIVLDSQPERRRLISKREAVVVGALVVVIVAVASVVAFRPHATPAGLTLPTIGVVPTFSPSATPAATPSATKSATRRATPQRTTAPATTAPAQPPPSQASTTPAAGVTVTYQVVRQWSTGFEGEVSVVNDEPSSISGWTMAIGLPDDTFTSWWNATGYMSNGILVLSQPSWEGPIAADGGTLHVFFIASGEETTPTDCGFNTQDCTIGS
jgi:hypothetical protein